MTIEYLKDNILIFSNNIHNTEFIQGDVFNKLNLWKKLKENLTN